MRLLTISLAILMLASCCNSSPPVAAAEPPAVGLPIMLSAEGRAAIEAVDPTGALAIDQANARYLCGYAPHRLPPAERVKICGEVSQ